MTLRRPFGAGRPPWPRLLVSALVILLGVAGGQGLSQVNVDLQVMYQEYTLAAVEIAHVSGEVLRYRATIFRALEAPTKAEFEAITAPLPAQRATIQHAIDRYAAASLRVSRSGRSEPEDLQAVRDSLEGYFSAASKTIGLLVELWNARSKQWAIELRQQAERHAADNAGPKLIQLTVALDRLLDTVVDVALDMRDEGTRTTDRSGLVLTAGSLLLAVFNLLAPIGDRPVKES